MPAVLTHTLFGNDVAALLNTSARKVALYDINAFNWGLLGPDILYFRKALTGGSFLSRCAKEIHKSKTTETFNSMYRYIETKENSWEFPVLVSYLSGFICHYYLDSVTHPFIWAMCRRYEGLTFDRSNGGIHHRIEADIDTEVYRHRKHDDPTRVRLNQIFNMSKDKNHAISLMYCYILKDVFNVSVGIKDITKSFNETIAVERAILDPSGFIVKFFANITDQFKGGVPFSSHIVSRYVKYDVLNLSNQRIANIDESKSQRFSDLYEIAAQLAANDINHLGIGIMEGRLVSKSYTKQFDNEDWDN